MRRRRKPFGLAFPDQSRPRTPQAAHHRPYGAPTASVFSTSCMDPLTNWADSSHLAFWPEDVREQAWNEYADAVAAQHRASEQLAAVEPPAKRAAFVRTPIAEECAASPPLVKPRTEPRGDATLGLTTRSLGAAIIVCASDAIAPGPKLDAQIATVRHLCALNDEGRLSKEEWLAEIKRATHRDVLRRAIKRIAAASGDAHLQNGIALTDELVRTRWRMRAASTSSAASSTETYEDVTADVTQTASSSETRSSTFEM